MAAWSEEDVERLEQLAGEGLSGKEIALILKRTEAAIRAKAAACEISIDSREDGGLRSFLRDGGHLIREEIGGAVGVHWARASRSGGAFSPRLCERLRELGLIVPTMDREHIFRGKLA